MLKLEEEADWHWRGGEEVTNCAPLGRSGAGTDRRQVKFRRLVQVVKGLQAHAHPVHETQGERDWENQRVAAWHQWDFDGIHQRKRRGEARKAS